MNSTPEHNQHLQKFKEFTSVLLALIELIKDITELEHSKAYAATNNQHNLIDSYINSEQACILKLRSLEQKRIHLAEVLGWKELTFREIIDLAEPGEREALQPLFEALNKQLKILIEARDAADRIIRIRLKELNEALAISVGMDTSPSYFKDKYV